MMTMGLLPERKINKPAVAVSFAAQVVFVVVLIQLGHIQPKKIVFAAKHMIYTPIVSTEVTLEVTFTAAGQVPVVRVVRGLGYGLDEQAIRAAQQIRFKPAQLGGPPIDSRAVVHIIFQLAS
jgi:TonB family protein